MGTTRRDLRTSGDLVMAPRVPHGLAAAVEGLTREVIRHRPEDIYIFAAQHFEELLKLRDEYGAVSNLPGKSGNTAALREMNQALKKRSVTEKSVAKTSKEKGGWSMNETARVLERHRSIFGDKGKKVSPEEVRALGNEKENKSRRRDDLERFANTTSQKRRGSNERFVRRKMPPRDAEPPDNKSKSDSSGNPKIISQIPTLTQSTGLLAKDIKSELRKNRNSSRDGRSIRERAERKASERFEIAARQSGATKKTLTRSSHERSLDKLIDVENDVEDLYAGRIGTDNQKQKTDASGRSRSFAKMPRTLSMDRVREFVVEKFRGSESWEELRSTNYVDRVQEVIDEASPSILRRVKELSTRSAGRSRGYESVDESTSTSTRSDKSNQTDDVRSRSAMSASRRSRRSTRRSKSKSRSKTSGADSLEGIETLASETEHPKETRNEAETGKLKKGIPKGAANGLSGESDASDYTDVTRKASASSSISLPAVRPPSSKNQSRSVSRSDSDNLVLPPIPPEAPRSAKLREELVLPSLQIAKETLRGVGTHEEDAVLLEETAEVELNLPDPPMEEIFNDSLNVTPELAASPRPDSLEPDAGAGAQNGGSRDNITELKSQLNGIKSGTDSERVTDAPDDKVVQEVGGKTGMEERLREIEETERRIENILKVEAQESRGENLDANSVKEKLIEIQEAEERLRNILDPGANVEESHNLKTGKTEIEVNDPGMKERLVEIEETEKRIEKILESEAQGTQKEANDAGIKEKLMEIEESEKRIEKILHSEVQEIREDNIDDGVKEARMEIEETEKKIEKILDSESQGVQKDAEEPEITEQLMEIEKPEEKVENILHIEAQKVQEKQANEGMKEKLMEIEETEKRIENILHPAAQEIQEEQANEGMKEKLMEIEETEKRIEKILLPEAQEVQEEQTNEGMKEKLMEIEETEKRIEKILLPEAQEVQEEQANEGMKEKLMEIEETEKRIEKILHPEVQEVQEDQANEGMKEKLMEIEETEKRIEKILHPEGQEVQEEQANEGMKEKLMEIEETEKRIEKILHPEGQEVQEEQANEGMKEKLMEIEETEKRIEKIFNSEVAPVEKDKPDAGFMKDKLMEIEEAEKRLEHIFAGTSGDEDKRNSDSKSPVGQKNVAPKTPFIPEIPSEYVTAANQVETLKEEDKHAVVAMDNQSREQSAKSEDLQKEIAELSDTKSQGNESKLEQFPLGTPDSLGNSYVLTEGSPYDIPDSVTTVIIPERQVDTPSSDVLEIVLEDNLDEGSKTREESPGEESREISLRNILDNFGEIVHQEAVTVPSSMDVDFIKNLKTSNDVVIAKKDLGLIAEEDDKDFTDIVLAEVAKDPVTPILHDIAESEEILEPEEARNSLSPKSYDPEDRGHESGHENGMVTAKEVKEAGSLETLKPEEELKKGENGSSFHPEGSNRESVDDPQPSGNRKKRSLETIEPELTSPPTTAIGSLQQNVTDSATTESTDEVKETTISDDGGNTAAESSVTSPSCAEELGARNSESSNEVKETTISDRPADETGKNLFSLVPQCHGSMPHVPELNLDSLQDITVSSFQLSDDATAEEEEDSDVGLQPQSENDASLTSATDEARKSQEHEPVYEETIVKEKVVVKEDPCTKVAAYVTEPNTEKLEEKADTSEPEEAVLAVKSENVNGEIAAKELQETTENVAEKVPEERHDEIAVDVDNKLPKEAPGEVRDEIAEKVDTKVLEKEPEEVRTEVAKDEAENTHAGIHEDVAEDKANIISEKELEDAREDVDKKIPEEVHENLDEHVDETVPDNEPREVHEAVAEDAAKKVPEEEPEKVHENLDKNVDEKVPKKEPGEVHEAVAEDAAKKVHEEVPEEEPKKGLEEVAEEIAKAAPDKKFEDVAKTFPEETHENVPEEVVGDATEKVPEETDEETASDSAKKEPEEKSEDEVKKEPEERPEDLASRSLISDLDTVSLKDFKALEASVGEEYSKDLPAEDTEVKVNPQSNSPPASSAVPEIHQTAVAEIENDSPMLVLPEVAEPTVPEELPSDPLQSSGKIDFLVSTDLDPPKAEVVTNDLDDDENHGERTQYHIYVPEVTASEDYSTTESSTFNSAATKIQAGVRGFLTRRRLQSAQRRSSTLDSVPSIQDSLTTDAPPHLEPIEEVGLAQAATTIQSGYRGYKARQRLRREDAVQKTTISVDNAFCGNGLQHTGEFHDCLPLPPFKPDEEESRDDERLSSHPEADVEVSASGSEDKIEHEGDNVSQGNPDCITESTTTKEESPLLDDDSSFGLLVSQFPYDRQGLNLVVLSGNDAAIQSQYLNFITSIEETDAVIPTGRDPSKMEIDGFSTLKTNVGIESLPLDDADASVQDSSVSAREPLAVPGSPTGLIIEELSRTEEATNDSLDLPGLSLEEKQQDGDKTPEKPKDVVEDTRVSLPPDASLGTMSFSMNVDDMLGLGGESDNQPAKMKPIFEVTVTPRDLLKLNRSQGSQASGDRVESPVTMMQIVPKSVDDKSDRSEEDREADAKRAEDGATKAAEITKDSSNEDDGASKTYSIEKK